MAASSSGVARLAVSLITETRYCISDHLLWFGAPLVGASHPCYEHLCPDPTPPPGCLSGLSATPVGNDPTATVSRPVTRAVMPRLTAAPVSPRFNRRWRLRTAGGQQADRSGWLCPGRWSAS